MRTISGPLQTYLTDPTGVLMEAMVWILARDRTTNAQVGIGFWTGDDHETITVGGTPRLYYGAGNIIDLSDPITYRNGLDVGSWKFTLSNLTPEFDTLFRTYDLRLAPVEVHRGVYNLNSGVLIEAPHRLLKGWIETAPLEEPEEGSEATCTINCVTSAMGLTKTLALNKSDAFQRTRSGDRFNRYAAVSGAVSVKWGVGQVNGATAPRLPTPINLGKWGDR